VSFAVMLAALVVGAAIILRALISGMRAHRRELALEVALAPVAPVAAPSHLSPLPRMDRILLATDGSEFSDGATTVAIDFAQKSGAQLTAMSAVLLETGDQGTGADELKQAEAAAEKVLQEVKAKATRKGIEISTVLREAMRPAKEVVRLADDWHADVIVMGRRGKRGLARLMVGESTREVIGYADCKVLVVPKAATMWSRRILLGTDGSRHSEMAGVVAGEFAKRFGLPVSVLAVMGPKHDEKRRAEGREAAERMRAALARDGVDAEATVVEGDPGTEVARFAQQRGADLIVMGSHGRTGFGRLLLGSVSEKVIGQATCPVLVVKA
jgi:nucleotide-binding universal stress UspA family protein